MCGGSLQSGDVRTWKSLLTHAYKGVAGMEGDAQAMLNDYSKITTAKVGGSLTATTCRAQIRGFRLRFALRVNAHTARAWFRV